MTVRRRMLRLCFAGLLWGWCIVLAQPETATSNGEELRERVRTLEVTLEERKKALEGAQKSTEFYFTLFLILATLMSGAFLVSAQLSERRNLRSFEETHRKDLDELKEETARVQQRQDEKTDKLMEVVQENIGKTTNLFGALGGMLELQQKASQWQSKMEEMEQAQHRQAVKTVAQRKRVIKEINQEAMDLSSKISRRNYSGRGSQETLAAFAVNLRAQKQEYGIEERELNGYCFLAHARLFRSGSVDERMRLCSVGLTRALDRESMGVYPAVSEGKEYEKVSRRCANECCFLNAIMLYNIGEYKQSLVFFERAVEYNQKDFESMIYIPEGMFLGCLAENLDSVESKFNEVMNVVEEAENYEGFSVKDKKNLIAQILVRLGNCFIGRSECPKYRGQRLIEKALNLYEQAYEYDPQTYLTKFSLAQALWAKAQVRKRAGQTYTEEEKRYVMLFREAFNQLHEKVASTVEGRIQIMLYYMMAICCRNGNIKGEMPQTYLALITREGSSLVEKERVRIFSPRTKRDLSLPELLKEVREFQATLG